MRWAHRKDEFWVSFSRLSLSVLFLYCGTALQKAESPEVVPEQQVLVGPGKGKDCGVWEEQSRQENH